MGVWNRDIELASREEIDQIRIERLQATLNRAMNNVPFYHDQFKENGIVPEKVHNAEDLARIPFTTRNDLVDHQPYGFFAVPLRHIMRIQASSGTTGRPVVVGYTRNDRRHWADLLARSMCAVGIDATDIVQVAFAYGLFSGGFGFDLGAEHLGATVIPVSVGNVDQQIRIMQDYHTSCLFSTPSFAMQISHVMHREGIRSQQLTLKKGIFGAEPWGEDVRHRIESALGIEAYDLYGISELMGPGVAGECEFQDGLHLWEDQFFPEIVDPETGEVLPPGERGELVITTLMREAMPLIRYRTGDITSFITEDCRCGRRHVRISRITNRKSDFLIVHGVNIYLRDIDELLRGMFQIPVRYQLVASTVDELDKLEVLIEVTDRLFRDELGGYRHMEATIRHMLSTRLSFEPEVRFVEPSHFPPQGVKYPRLVDKRSAS